MVLEAIQFPFWVTSLSPWKKQSIKLITHFHLVQRPRIHGDLHPCPCMPHAMMLMHLQEVQKWGIWKPYRINNITKYTIRHNFLLVVIAGYHIISYIKMSLIIITCLYNRFHLQLQHQKHEVQKKENNREILQGKFNYQRKHAKLLSKINYILLHYAN